MKLAHFKQQTDEGIADYLERAANLVTEFLMRSLISVWPLCEEFIIESPTLLFFKLERIPPNPRRSNELNNIWSRTLISQLGSWTPRIEGRQWQKRLSVVLRDSHERIGEAKEGLYVKLAKGLSLAVRGQMRAHLRTPCQLKVRIIQLPPKQITRPQAEGEAVAALIFRHVGLLTRCVFLAMHSSKASKFEPYLMPRVSSYCEVLLDGGGC